MHQEIEKELARLSALISPEELRRNPKIRAYLRRMRRTLLKIKVAFQANAAKAIKAK